MSVPKPSRERTGARRLLHRLLYWPLSTWPVIDLAGAREAYAMQGRCDNCGRSIAIVQARGERVPDFVSRDDLDCPVCGISAVHGVFDMDLKAVGR